MARREVVHCDQQESCFDACDIERQHSRGRDAVRRAGLRDRIPQRDGLRRIYPDLVAEVAGVAGARDRHRNSPDLGTRQPEVFQTGEIALGGKLQDLTRAWALEREGSRALRDVLNLHIETRRVQMQPPQRGIGRGHAVRLIAQDRDRTVVDLFALVVTPGRVQHLADLGFADVARDDVIEQPRGVTAGDQVLVQRRDIEQRRGIPNRVVFAIVRELVGARDDVPGPAPPGLTFGQWTGAGMKRRGAEAHVARNVTFP